MLIAIVAPIALAPLLLTACKSEPRAVLAPQPVQVMTVTLEQPNTGWSYVGVVKPRYQADLGFRVAGKVARRLVEVGEKVAAGQTLARLDDTDLQLALSAQSAELAAARTSSAEAQAAVARYRTLHAKGHVAQAALDQRVSAAAESTSRVERAERNVELARNQLAYANLQADHAGIVVAVPVEAGQVVSVGQPVVRLARLGEVEAEVALPEQMLARVRAATATISVWAENSDNLPATLREVGAEADPVSRTYRARFAIRPDAPAIPLGRTVTVHLSTQADHPVATVPISAVTSNGAGAFVWRLTQDATRVARTPVTVDSYGASTVLVRSGLAAGDRIVTMGTHLLDEARAVQVVEQRATLSEQRGPSAKAQP